MEVWGAQGGYSGSTYRGGYGGYSTGVTNKSKNSKLYINVGGMGSTIVSCTSSYCANGGYNGGGNAVSYCIASSTHSANSGGGSTHIATVSGLLKDLSSYKNTGGTNISNEILAVAGGGGGMSYYSAEITTYNGGNGGGISGVSTTGKSRGASYTTYLYGGDQTNASAGTQYTSSDGTKKNELGSFGKGGDGVGDSCGGSGAGGGWFGGTGAMNLGPAPGGSGYIGSSNLISGASITKHMTCYSCTTSSVAATRTYSNTNVSGTATADYSKTGNGYARITYLGTSI